VDDLTYVWTWPAFIFAMLAGLTFGYLVIGSITSSPRWRTENKWLAYGWLVGILGVAFVMWMVGSQVLASLWTHDPLWLRVLSRLFPYIAGAIATGVGVALRLEELEVNTRERRRIKAIILATWQDAIGDGYVLGARGLGEPPVWDCRGLWEGGFRAAGALEAIGGESQNVRREYAKNEAAGRLRDPSVIPGSTWGAIFAEVTDKPEPGNALHMRHVAGVIEAPSAENPDGVMISALNPKAGVKQHGFTLHGEDGRRYKILAFIQPNYNLVGTTSVPITDPEPPVVVAP
jgi:hypothetical protein